MTKFKHVENPQSPSEAAVIEGREHIRGSQKSERYFEAPLNFEDIPLRFETVAFLWVLIAIVESSCNRTMNVKFKDWHAFYLARA